MYGNMFCRLAVLSIRLKKPDSMAKGDNRHPVQLSILIGLIVVGTFECLKSQFPFCQGQCHET